MTRRRHLLLFLGFFAQTLFCQAQQPCAMPSFSTVVNDPNIFNEQQEEWLGEILAPQIEKDFNVIADPENDYLQKLGERLLAQLPPTKIHYRFTIIDEPANDSFGFAGGHVYVSRRLLALAQNEDELAGVLGHEIGHIITHQSAINATRDFREMLGVTQVTDRQDILNKWNRLLDASARSNERWNKKREQQEQLIADRIALYAMARAGYIPSRFADFFDRLTQIKGNKGNFWSDFFGATSPESRRLRELVRDAISLPPECVVLAASDSPQHFLKWQKAIIASDIAVSKESIPGLLKKITLSPPLRGDLESIQFSGDGKYLLAQDESSVFVLSHNPLATLFRVDAIDASAQFTPDSRMIVLVDKELRVELWDIATRQRSAIHQVVLPGNCLQKALSPSGEILACIGEHFELQLINVADSQPVFVHKDFYHPAEVESLTIAILAMLGVPYSPFELQFSPDNRYFAAGHRNTTFAYDLIARSEMKLPGKLKAILGGNFVFRAPDEIAGFSFEDSKSILQRMRFPSGDNIDRFPLPTRGALVAPAKGDYLLLSVNAANVHVAVVDLNAKKISLAYKVSGFAIYDQVYAAETMGGAVALVKIPEGKAGDGLRLPLSPLNTSKVAEFSPNGKWLAVSGGTRGALWNLETGERKFFVPTFEGVFFEEDHLITLAKRGKDPSVVTRVNAVNLAAQDLYALPADEADDVLALDMLMGFPSEKAHHLQLGSLLITEHAGQGKEHDGFLIEAFDIHVNKKLWEKQLKHEFPKLGYSSASDTLTMLLTEPGSIQWEAKLSRAFDARLHPLLAKQELRDFCVVKVLDSSTGKESGTVLVNAHNISFNARSAIAEGDTLVVNSVTALGEEERALIYSVQSGDRKGEIFGKALALSKNGDRLLVENGRGEVDLYDTFNAQSLAHFTFPATIVRAEFVPDGSGFFALTADQVVYRVKNTEKVTTAARQLP